jgi:hypothetical protein
MEGESLKMYLLITVFNFIFQAEFGRVRADNLVSSLIMFFIVGTLAVIFLLGVIAFLALGRKKRIETHQNFATREGWQSLSDESLNFIQNPHHYSLFMNVEGKNVYGLIQKSLSRGNLFAFEYKFRVGNGEKAEIFTQTVLAFHSRSLNLPYFSLYPERKIGFIGSAFGYNDVNFSSHPNFSQRYRLSTTNESSVRYVFNPLLLSNLEHLPDINIDGGGQYLFIYELKKSSPLQQFDSFINERMRFVNLFAQ